MQIGGLGQEVNVDVVRLQDLVDLVIRIGTWFEVQLDQEFRDELGMAGRVLLF